jgi:hypothetical protein
MGAWGFGSFENDAALDWLGDLGDGDPSLLGEALDRAAGVPVDAYLDADDCCAALAAAELVAAALDRGTDRLSNNATSWLKTNQDAARLVGADRARQAVERVLEKSELRDLWGEGGTSEWHDDVQELLKRLRG